jgi:hypothetical protein
VSFGTDTHPGKVCQAMGFESEAPDQWWPWYCTLPAGHEGEHVAHGLQGRVFYRWTTEEATQS